jgi:hypothetical protein
MAHDNQHRYAKGLFGLLLIAAGLHLPLTHAADQEDDEVNTGWQESALQLPAAPKSENLLPFYNSGTQTFSIDKPSVSVEKDGSVRYTLVSTSSNGAKNVSYEAIRCESYEKSCTHLVAATAPGQHLDVKSGTEFQMLALTSSTTFYTPSICVTAIRLQEKRQ